MQYLLGFTTFNVLKIIFYIFLLLLFFTQAFIIFIILLQKGENYDTMSKLRSVSVTTSNPSIRILTIQFTIASFIFLYIIHISLRFLYNN